MSNLSFHTCIQYITLWFFASTALHLEAIGLPSTPQVPAGKEIRSITFVGTSLKSGKLRFTGSESLFKTKNRYVKLTKYYSPKKELLLWDIIEFTDDLTPNKYHRFGKNPKFSMKLNNSPNGFTLEAPDKKTIRGKWPKSSFLPKNLHEFTLSNMDKILKGEKISLSLFLPDLGKNAYFWLIPTANKTSIQLRLKIKNLLLRPFVPKILFEFNKKTGDVLSYEGPALFEMKQLAETKIKIKFKTKLNTYSH